MRTPRRRCLWRSMGVNGQQTYPPPSMTRRFEDVRDRLCLSSPSMCTSIYGRVAWNGFISSIVSIAESQLKSIQTYVHYVPLCIHLVSNWSAEQKPIRHMHNLKGNKSSCSPTPTFPIPQLHSYSNRLCLFATDFTRFL